MLQTGGGSAPTKVAWQLSTRAVRIDPDGSTVVAARAAMTGTGGAPVANDMRPPMLIRLAADCSHAAYAWRRDADLTGARSQQALAARFAFVLPAAAATPTMADVWDDNGRYRMAAVRADRGDEIVVHARNLGYARAVASGRNPLAGALRIDGAGLRVRLQRNGWVESAALEQAMQSYGPDGTSVHLQAELQRTDRGLATSGADPDDGGWVWGNLLADPGLGRRARLRADAELAAMDADTLLAELRAADPSAEHVAEMLRVLEAWLLANPKAAGQLQAWLQRLGDGYAGNQLARVALAALGRCGLPQARAALRNLGEDNRAASALRLHATLNLATAEGVDAADLGWLRRRAAERVAADAGSASQDSTAALAALGIAANQPSLCDTPERAQALTDIANALRDPSDPRYVLAAVNGAGNAADPQLLPALLPLAENADSDIRRRVADALRGMPAESVEAVFGPWLAREVSPAVAAELVAAFAAHYARGDDVPPAVLDPALAKLASEGNLAVAQQLVALVGKASGQSAAAKAALVARFRAAAADPQAAALAVAIGEYVSASELVGP